MGTVSPAVMLSLGVTEDENNPSMKPVAEFSKCDMLPVRPEVRVAKL